jgi:IS30 family transposase
MSEASSFASADCAVADVYGPTATSDATSAAASPGVSVTRAPSTVSREVAGNGGRAGYRALAADRTAWARAARPKQTRLARWPRLRAMVEDKLELSWSPVQIVGWLRRRFPTGTVMHAPYETIYRSCSCRPAATCARADPASAHASSDAPPRRRPTA